MFVITADGVWGAGRYVAFVNVEQLDVDGGRATTASTSRARGPSVQTRIFGGLGSDTSTSAATPRP